MALAQGSSPSSAPHPSPHGQAGCSALCSLFTCSFLCSWGPQRLTSGPSFSPAGLLSQPPPSLWHCYKRGQSDAWPVTAGGAAQPKASSCTSWGNRARPGERGLHLRVDTTVFFSGREQIRIWEKGQRSNVGLLVSPNFCSLGLGQLIHQGSVPRGADSVLTPLLFSGLQLE